MEEATHIHYKGEINYHDYKNFTILSAQTCKYIMCLYKTKGQIVSITGVKCANLAIQLDQ